MKPKKLTHKKFFKLYADEQKRMYDGKHKIDKCETWAVDNLYRKLISIYGENTPIVLFWDSDA